MHSLDCGVILYSKTFNVLNLIGSWFNIVFNDCNPLEWYLSIDIFMYQPRDSQKSQIIHRYKS